MLDGILGRGFASKCKSLIKVTKNRIDVNRRKKNATLKFLKKDMADLLANGLDINAYGRAEGLLDELRQIWCYDFIEQCCDFLLKHLSILQKIRHCPEDCRGAVSCLMFAAARFSELPELRELRDTFYDRYGSTVELFVNQEFVENSCKKPSTKEKKVQLMQDISTEFSIKWDRRACEQMMSRFPVCAQDQSKTYGSAQTDQHKPTTGKETVLKGDERDLSSNERFRHDLDGQRFFNGKESNLLIINELNHKPGHDISRIGYKQFNIKEETILKEDPLLREMHEAGSEKYESGKEILLKTVRLGSASQRKKADSGSVGSKLQDRRWNVVHTRDGGDTLALGKPDVSPHNAGLAGDNYGGNKIAGSTRDIQVHEVCKPKPYSNIAIPPPYIKSNAKPMDSKHGTCLGSLRTGSDDNVVPKAPLDNRNKAVSGSDRVEQEAYHLDRSRKSVASARENGDGHENHNYYQQDGVGNSIPKPRSMRRKHSKSHSSHNDANNMEDTGVVKRRSRSRRRNDSKKGLQILVDDDQYEDEEERMIDKLLLHYSKKPASQEPGKLRRESRSRFLHHRGSEADKSRQHIGRDGPDETLQRVFPPRSISLPNEQTASLPNEQTALSGATKTFMRVASFQSDKSAPARHVHPKLPDYDDLAARFTALKGR